MKLEIEMTIAETRSFAENIAVEMISADAVSFDEVMNFDALDSFDEMMFAETKSFDEINSDPFSSWYEVWTEAFEVSETAISANWCCCTKAAEATEATKATDASETWNVSNATLWINL